MMPTREELLAAIKKLPLIIHRCGMCNYPCNFGFLDGELCYDAGCDCTRYPRGYQPRDVEDLDFYLEPSNGWEENLKAYIIEAQNHGN